MRLLSVTVVLSALAAGGQPISLGSAPLISGDAFHVAAMGDVALAAWNVAPTSALSIFTARLFDDGGMAMDSAARLGTYSSQGPRVVAVPSVGHWLVAWPDWNSGGQTGGSRVDLDGGVLEPGGIRLSFASFSSRVRAAGRGARVRVLDDASPGFTSVDVQTWPTLVSSPFVARPEIVSPVFDVAFTNSMVAWCWGFDAGTECQLEFDDGGTNSFKVTSGRQPIELALTTRGAAIDLSTLERLSDGGRALQLHRFDETSLAGTGVIDDVSSMSTASDGQDTWVSFVRGGALWVLPPGAVVPVLVPGTVNAKAVAIAPVGGSRAWLVWSALVSGSMYPFAQLIDLAPQSDAGGSDAGGSDAGGSDAGGSDAGGSDAGGSDAGGSDAGGSDAGGSDAGPMSVDGGTFDDAGKSPGSRQRLEVGCTVVGGWPLMGLLVVLRRRRRGRALA